MDTLAPFASRRSRSLALARGSQVVINGAIVTASQPCTIQVEAGAYILAGSAMAHRNAKASDSRQELYLSLLDMGGNPTPNGEEFARLYCLLSEIAADGADQQAQQDCSQCCAALMMRRIEAATHFAASLASSSLAQPQQPKSKAQTKRHVSEDIAFPQPGGLSFQLKSLR